jgi:PD-(D/E)XK nuclease superfamily
MASPPRPDPAPETASSMDVKTFWSTADWASAIARMPSPGPLPTRTVLVPREPVAHTLRRELIRSGLGKALAGTRFLPVAAGAVEVLREAGTVFTPGEESLRAARMLGLFRAGLELTHFPLELLRSTPGWDDAFARTISDLEAAGLRAEDLKSKGDSRLHDVATIWRAADASAGTSWTIQRIFSEAAAALEINPKLWIFPGPILGCARGSTTGAEARFLRSVPGLTLGLLAARPLRARYLDRMEALFGRQVRNPLLWTPIPSLPSTERDILANYLFESPAVLAKSDRSRSSGPDGTVDFEEHAGVEAELEATADWVARQIGDGIPLEEIAVLLPSLDAAASLVVERIQRLPHRGGALPVHSAGGLPVTRTSAGARALTVVRALRSHLEPGALSEVLPALRADGSTGNHLSHADALTVVWSLGTAGGNPARPEGALEWAVRAVERQGELTNALLLSAGDEDGDPHQARRFEGLHGNLLAITPALEALVGLARLAIKPATLAELWPALRQFLETWLLQPSDGPRVQTLLDGRLKTLASDRACASLAGDDAMNVIEETIAGLRLSAGRFGDPAVYVGSVMSAVGLTFQAVRVIGLAEGRLPSIPREDPVIPDSIRAMLQTGASPVTNAWMTTAADRALDDLHALDTVIRGAQTRIALSFPRTDLDRSQREPSSVLLEAAAALGRPNSTTGAPGQTIPDAASLGRDAFQPARVAAAAFRRAKPLSEAAWQDGVSRGELAIPSPWRGIPCLDLPRIEQLRSLDGKGGAMDGLLEIADLAMLIPGITRDRPISPSALERLLGCPHRFLLQNLLGFGDAGGAPPQREIGQPFYGNLFHETARSFSEQHGSEFATRSEPLADWRVRADAVADAAFAEFVREYPLVGEAVRSHERDRLRRDLWELLDHEREKHRPRRLIAAERNFGRPDPLELEVGDARLFVHGRIDRLEVEGATTIVTDFKTGKPHPRTGKELDPDPVIDLQLAVYALAARSLAKQWKTPRKVTGAYLYIGRFAPTERAFDEDFEESLEPAAQTWLSVATGLLTDRIFPRTLHRDDCNYCGFKPVCGDDALRRSGEVVDGATGTLGAFRKLKLGEADEEEDEED